MNIAQNAIVCYNPFSRDAQRSASSSFVQKTRSAARRG